MATEKWDGALGILVPRETATGDMTGDPTHGFQERAIRGQNVPDHLELSRLCKLNGLEIQPRQLSLLQRYVTLLLKWNSRINLVSRKDEDSIWTQHLLHSLSLLFHITFKESTRVLDLGTGGGLPGVPLAIMRPDVDFILLDSIRKKTLAVENMILNLNLGNVKVLCCRAEDLAAANRSAVECDVIVARAVAPTNKLIKWSIPLTRNWTRDPITFYSEVGTKKRELLIRMPFLLAMKGGNLQEEIAAARAAFGEKKIIVGNLSIEGFADGGLIDKKVVMVEL